VARILFWGKMEEGEKKKKKDFLEGLSGGFSERPALTAVNKESQKERGEEGLTLHCRGRFWCLSGGGDACAGF